MRGASASCIGDRRQRGQRGGGQPELLDGRARGRQIGGRRDHERPGRKLDALGGEALLGDLHRHVLAARSGTRSCCSSRSARPRGRRCPMPAILPLTRRPPSTGRRRDVEDGLVLDLLHVDQHRQPHRPAAVVVGRAGSGSGIALLLEQVLRQAAVRLIALDDVRSRPETSPSPILISLGRQADLDPLHAQDVDELGDARHVALHGNHERRTAPRSCRPRSSSSSSGRSSRR